MSYDVKSSYPFAMNCRHTMFEVKTGYASKPLMKGDLSEEFDGDRQIDVVQIDTFPKNKVLQL